MTGRRYSAGAIFLQVEPVFGNFQRAMQAHARDIDAALGDQMERSGDRAGQRAGRAASESMRDEMERRNRGWIDLDSLTRDMERSGERAGDAAGQGISRGMRDGVRRGRRDVDREMGAFETSFKRAIDRAARSLGTSMNPQVRALRQQLDTLKDVHVGVDMNANEFRRQVAEVHAEIQRLNRSDVDIDVRADTGRAMVELGAVLALVQRIDRQRVSPHVDTRSANSALHELAGSGETAANSFRSFNIVLLAVAALGPSLVPILGAIAGGLLAIGPAAAVAGFSIGTLLVGFSGLKDVLTALSNQEDQAANTTQQAAKRMQTATYAVADAKMALADAERAAARAAEDAARRVADARESAADAVEAALDRQRQAQEDYRDAVQDVKDAEQALQEARDNAKGTGQDLATQIKENALAIDQAMLDEFNTTVTFNAVMADGSATNAEKEQARIDMEQAKLRMEELRQRQKELAEEKKKWDEQGVEGTDQVKSAQEQLTAAIEAQQQAYEDMKDAALAVDEARVDGAEAVRDALRDQAQAVADSARAIDKAQEALRRANEGFAESATEVSTQQNAVNAAMAKLGPAGQEFALFLYSLRKGFRDFRDDVQEVLLPSIQLAIEGFLGSSNAQVARAALLGLADSFGKFAIALSKSFQGEAWGAFFTMLGRLGPKIQSAYGGAFIKFLEGIASMLTTLSPFALKFARGLERMMGAFANWAKSKKGQDELTRFMRYAERIGPKVIAFLKALVKFAVAVAVGLAQWGEITMGGMTAFLNTIADLDPKVLAAIVTSLFVLITASQTAYATMNLLNAGAALLTSPIGLVIFLIIGIVAALVYLYNTNEDFRNFVIDAWERISAAFAKAWEDDIKPALDQLLKALDKLWKDVLEPFFAWLGPILVTFIEHWIPIMAKGWVVAINLIAWSINHILVPVIKIVAAIFKWLWFNILAPVFGYIGRSARFMWKEQLKPAFEGIADLWHAMSTGMEWVWDNVLHPVFKFITDTALPALSGAFETTVNAIKTVWETLKKVVGAPIKFVLQTIINEGLIAGFNKVADWVGMDGFDPIPIPAWMQKYAAGGIMRRPGYATGGVLPGYTPGRDVHKFVSPTGGRLELSGGEAIMRPEFTAAVGPQFVNMMNAVARSSGVTGVRRMMRAASEHFFADGGIFGGTGFAKGGILNPDDKVYINGMAISRIAAAQAALAHEISGINMYMMQGGYGGNHIAASGSSHNYPGVGDFGPGSISLETAMRKTGFAAWARNVPGRSFVGSGAHVHAASLLDPGNQSSPQIYGSWPNHGNGLSGYNNDPAPHYAWIPHLVERISAMGIGNIATTIGGMNHPSLPGWLMSIVKNPLAAVKGWITGGWDKASAFVSDSPVYDAVKRVPLLLAEKVTDKVWDIVPGWAKTAAGWAGDAADWAVGGVKGALHGIGDTAGDVADFLGFADGGILPYNGTMKYDDGGYLPPGLTSVVNLTGKPEPVFTADQMEGGAGPGGNITYAPTYNGVDFDPEDIVGDLNFNLRKLQRGGKYAGVGD